jgi:hypothetical protein
MGTRNFLHRLAQAEKALQDQSVFSPDCICFPPNEPPFFCFPVEEEVAGEVKCPLHGERFQHRFHIYVAKWYREKSAKILRDRLSAQHQKAWLASFPPALWPAEEEETEDGRVFLRLKDGTRLLAFEPCWPQRPNRPTGVA